MKKDLKIFMFTSSLLLTFLISSSILICAENMENDKNYSLEVAKHLTKGVVHLVKGAGHGVVAGVEIAKNKDDPVQVIKSTVENIDHIEKATEETTLSAEETTYSFDDFKKGCNLF